MKKYLFLLAIIFHLISTKVVFSQKWEKNQPNILFATDKNGNFNDVKIGIRTPNPQHSLDVRGKIFTDSIHVLKQIEIGNSIFLGAEPC